MNLKLLTPPTLDLVPLAEMKAHLRVDDSESDDLIAGLTNGAIAHLDGYRGVLGWCIGAQTWLLGADGFPDGFVRLPFGPLLEVESIDYTGADGANVTMPGAEYEVDDVTDPAVIAPVGSWPSVDAMGGVRITFRVGHESAADHRLAAVKVIVKLLVGHWYANREAVGGSMSEVPMSAGALIAAHRRMMV